MKKSKKKVTIILPVYNEEETVEMFYQSCSRICKDTDEYQFHYLYVNDGSTDRTLFCLNRLCAQHSDISFISYFPNKGKENAIYKGLCFAKESDYIVLMDVDLQHPPELIPQMLNALKTKEVSGIGAKRETGLFSTLFTFTFRLFTSLPLPYGATDYTCMKQSFVQELLPIQKKFWFFKGAFAAMSSQTLWIDYQEKPRVYGSGKWNFRKLVRYAISSIRSCRAGLVK